MNEQFVSPIPFQSPKPQMSQDEDKDAEPFEAAVQKLVYKSPAWSSEKCVFFIYRIFIFFRGPIPSTIRWPRLGLKMVCVLHLLKVERPISVNVC